MKDDIDEAIKVILKTCENENVSLFVGAGISIENPANLPSAAELKWDILNLLLTKPPSIFEKKDIEESKTLLQDYLSGEMLELMIQDIAEVSGERALKILEVFNFGEPNLYHLLIAKLAQLGLINRVFTTNFDILIERALAAEGVKYNVFETEHDFAEYLISPEKYNDFHVFKLHGTIAFTKGGKTQKQREVEAISDLKFQMRSLKKYLEKKGRNVSTIGFERRINPDETLVASISRIGFKMPEYVSKALTNNLKNSTFIIIGWNGFDLDISPLFLKNAKKIFWFVHNTGIKEIKNKLSNTEKDIKEIKSILRSKGWRDTQIQFALLATGNLIPDALPSAEKEREEIIKKSEGESFFVFTPQLIRKLWKKLSNRIGSIPKLPDITKKVKKQIYNHQQRWCESIQSILCHWGAAKFMIYHGEYENTVRIILELLEPIRRSNYHDIEALMYIDMGELHANYGEREEANRFFLKAIKLFQEKVREGEKLSGIFRPTQLIEIPEKAYFGMGVLACDFFRFKEAEKAFINMNTDESIIKVLVHFCNEEFDEAIQLLSEIKFRYDYTTKFHYYLSYFLRLLDADMFWIFKNYDNAIKLYEEVLVNSTKVGWPRHQVHALNGLTKTYSAQGKQLDMLKAAKYANESIKISNMAEYRVGRAFAGYYSGCIYASISMNDIAERSFKFAEKYFRSMGHEAGLNFCASARRDFDI